MKTTAGQMDTLYDMIIEVEEYVDPLRVDITNLTAISDADDTVEISDELFNRMRAAYSAVIDLHNQLRDTIDGVRS